MPDETPPASIKETDAELVAILNHLLNELGALIREYDTLHRDPPAADSVLSADNAATSPHYMGQFVGYCMLQAADTSRSITRVVRGEDGKITLPIMSVFTLARSVIECAATAIWVLEPSDRRTRVLRRLQFAHDELTYETDLVEVMASSFDKSTEQAAIRDDAKSRRTARAELRRIADANGIKYTEYENQFPGWLSIVETGGKALPDPGLLPSMWRMCSGMSHPSLRRGLNLSTFTPLGESGNILRGTLSANTQNVVGVLAITHLAARTALGRWRAVKGLRNAEVPVPSSEVT